MKRIIVDSRNNNIITARYILNDDNIRYVAIIITYYFVLKNVAIPLIILLF